jgi:hypothetical protein
MESLDIPVLPLGGSIIIKGQYCIVSKALPNNRYEVITEKVVNIPKGLEDRQYTTNVLVIAPVIAWLFQGWK